MKIIISEKQLKMIVELIEDGRVICDCGWSWDLSVGGDDPYICHKCGTNNEEK